MKWVTLGLQGSNTSFAFAPQGKRVFKTHGRRSNGPKTEASRQRPAEAQTTYGRDTREARTDRCLASARLAVLEAVGFGIRLLKGPEARGVKPNRMAEAYPKIYTLNNILRAKPP